MTVLDINEIKKILPHRYPMLLVDRILEVEPMKRAVGIKNITANEMQFLGHFPNEPIMPGVLLIEAMAQVGGVAMLYPEENRGKIAVFAKIDNVRFRKQVVPGDQVVIMMWKYLLPVSEMLRQAKIYIRKVRKNGMEW